MNIKMVSSALLLSASLIINAQCPTGVMEIGGTTPKCLLMTWTPTAPSTLPATVNIGTTVYTLTNNPAPTVNSAAYTNNNCNGSSSTFANGTIVFAGGLSCSYNNLGVLPVKFVSLTAKYSSNNQLQVAFVTTDEIDNDYFEIQLSSNGKDWEIIDRVSPDLNRSQKNEYFSSVPIQLNGTKYVRIKQIDVSGTYSYSDIANVDMRSIQTLTLSPNPVSNGNLMISGLQIGKEAYTFDIVNAIGQVVKSNITLQNNVSVDVTSLPNGIYYLQLPKEVKTEKRISFVVSK